MKKHPPFSAEQGVHSWEGAEEGSLPLAEEREEEDDELEDDEDGDEEEEEWKDREGEHSPSPKKNRRNGDGSEMATDPPTRLTGEMESPSTPPQPQPSPLTPLQPHPSPPSDPTVCAKNISLTASGEKVILWTR